MANSNVLLIPGAYSSQRSSVVLSSKELVYDYNDNAIYFGDGATLGGVILATGNGGGVQAVSGSNGSFTASTVTFGNLNGITFYTSNGSLVGSYNSTLNTSNVIYTSANLHLTNVSATLASGNISISVAPPGAMSISAGTSSAAIGSIVYTNSNGVSFGLDGSTLSASVKTDYVQTSQSSLFQHTSATSNITSNALNTSQSSLFELSSHTTVFLTSQSNQAFSASNGSQTFQTIRFVDGQGVSFSTDTNGINASVRTDYQSSGNYLTTARASNDAIGLNTALTANGVSVTANSSGLSLNFPAFLTTAMQSDAGSNFINTSQSSLFQHTSATSNITSNAVNTSSPRIQGIIGSDTTYTSGSVSLRDLNGITFQSTTGQAFQITHDLQYTSNTSNITSLAFPSANTTKFAGTGTSATNASLTLDSNGLAISVANAVTTNGLISAINLSAGTTSNNLTKVTFSDSNGISFGLNGSVITATVKTDYQSSGNYLTTAALSGDTSKYLQNWKLTGNTAGTTSSAQGTDLWLAGGNGVTISGSSNTLSFSVATNYQSQGAYLTTAMASDRGTDFVQANAVFNGTNASGTIASNNISISVADQSVQPVAISGSNGSFTFNTVTFGALNGLTFYTTNNRIVGSYTVPTVTNSSFSIQDSATTINPVERIAFSTGNNITLSLSTGASSATVGIAHNLAGTSSGFTGGASISGSMTHNSSGLAISLSHPAWLTTAMQSNAATISNINLSAGTTSNNLSKFEFNNGNGVSFGLNGSTITASHNGITSQSNQNISLYALGNTTQNSSTVLNASNLSLSGSGNITVGYSNGSIIIGQTGGAGGAALSAGANSQNTGTVNFANSNGITFGLSNNGTLTASHNGITSQTNQSLGLYAVGNTTQNSSTTLDARTLSLNGLGAMSVGYSNGSIQVSAPNSSVLSGGNYITISTNGSTISIIGASVAAAPVSFSAGTTSNTLGNIVFSNSNRVSFGLNGSTVTASVNGIDIGVSNLGKTAGTTGTLDGIGGQYIFAATNGIGLSQSSNGSSGTMTIYPELKSEYSPLWAMSGMATNSSLGQSTVYFQPFDIDTPVYGSRINFYVSLSGALSAGNSTGTCYAGIGYALYTRDNGTGSASYNRLTSYSASIIQQSMSSNTQYAATHYIGLSNVTSHSTSQFGASATNASTYQVSSVNGLRVVALPLNLTLTQGRYWLAVSNITVTGNAMTNNMSVAITSVDVIPAIGIWGTSSTATNASFPIAQQGWGTYSAQTGAFPSTIGVTNNEIKAPVNQTLIHFKIAGYATSTNFI